MDPQTARIEHLKLIQAAITRLARNSFAIKSLAVAASAVLIAFTAAAETPLASVGGAALLPLWWLDASYLRQERLFRGLYDYIRAGPPAEFGAYRYFSMDVSVAEQRKKGIFRVVVSRSILLVYPPLLALIGVGRQR